jgi:DNA invertase Pin-like site-specific DNA recombinase
MSDNPKIQTTHLQRSAYVYIRQSTAAQVAVNRESTDRQYRLRERALQLGWPQERIKIIDGSPLGSDWSCAKVSRT